MINKWSISKSSIGHQLVCTHQVLLLLLCIQSCAWPVTGEDRVENDPSLKGTELESLEVGTEKGTGDLK